MRRLLFATSALVPLGIAAAVANPLGGSVVGGSATINGSGTSNVTINQSSQRAVINWNQFNIGAGETTQFIQPNSSSTVLNRVMGDPNPSQIFGTLSANGKVFLINPNGVLIGNGAVVNTAGFMATTADIANADFMAGRYNFNIPGKPDASIVNLGSITATNAGFAALVAPGVRNSGTITATFGKVGLASANTFSLDLYGDKLIQLGVNDSIAGSVRDVATGETLKSLVTNDGKIKANGGRVELTAVAARQVVDSVINTSGVIEARSIGQRNGKIVLGAATGASKPAGAPTQTVKVSGKLDASSKKAKGGKVEVVAENIVINDATIDASGKTGGGTVLIGGDIGGGKGNALVMASLEPYAIGTATTVSISGGTVIDASARSTGNGGKVVVWADDRTVFDGQISARGGEISGNGGFAEVSGKNTLSYTGLADLRAPNGAWGTLLLDPGNLNIVFSGTTTTTGTFNGSDTADTTLLAADLVAALGTANVIVQTGTGTGCTGGVCLGDIVVETSFSWATASTLTLSAFRNVTLNSGVTISSTGGGDVVLRADSTGSGVGTVIFTPTSGISTSGDVSIYYNPVSYTDAGTKSDALTNPYSASVTGGGTLTSYMLVNTVGNLDAIRTNLSGRYALGRDIEDVSETIAIFAPIGAISPTQFTGILDGSGGLGINHEISGLVIAPTGPLVSGVGLFGVIGATGIVRNLVIDGATVTPNPSLDFPSIPGQFVGVVAGQNAGLISNVTIIDSIISSPAISGGVIAGGVVGQNGIFGPGGAFGTITGAIADVAITLGNAASLFQLNIAGGVAGSNPGTITLSSASGNISVGENSVAGGLVGQNGAFGTVGAPALISLSSATGNVTSTALNVTIGGLVGMNFFDGTIIDSVYSGTTVSATANAPECSGFPCAIVQAGGLVGSNEGLIVGTDDFATEVALGATVTVGSHGTAGGLVAFNSGIIMGARSRATVLGASGVSDNGGATVLGGFAGANIGTIVGSRAEGTVGVAETIFMIAGGFVGDNGGSISSSIATGNVITGNLSQAGGFLGVGEGFDCVGCNPQGIGFNTTATITDSFAFGNVTVGTSSIAGGFAGSSGNIFGSSSEGTVTGGSGSILGGFAAVHGPEGIISDSHATPTATVTATGPNSWVGGFVGVNAGTIIDSTAAGAVSGGSSSFVGGFAGLNLGFIDPSSASGDVSVVGDNSFLGGFFGVNFGTIQTVSSTGLVSFDGSNNVSGTLGGANAAFINYGPGILPGSFPTGTVVNSSGTVGVTFPLQLPTHPAVMDLCNEDICALYKQGILGVPGGSIPNQVQTPPIFNYIPPPNNNLPLTLVTLPTTPGGVGPGVGPGPGPSGPATFPGARPGFAGFTPPPFTLRLGPDGMVPSAMPAMGETRFVPNQLLMRIATAELSPALIQILRGYGITVLSTDPLAGLGGGLVTLQLPPGMTLRQAIVLLEADRRIPGLSTNSTFTLSQAINTKGDAAQYLLEKFQIGKAHQVATGKDITIAVIDSEADKRHTELQGAISGEFSTLGAKSSPHSHGTAMIGAIASRDRLLGVAPNARIIAVSAFGEANATAEGTTASIIKGIEWAMSQNARVINMSFAGPRDPALERTLKVAFDHGLVLVAAAGNAGPKSPPLYPAADPHVIAVTATDVRDRGFRGANQGAQVSVSAPGVEILAPAPDAGYQMSTGTSIATAHISGVVALMLERNPRLKPADVRRILEETATDLGPKGKDAQFGWGLVNPQKALDAATALIKSSDASLSRR